MNERGVPVAPSVRPWLWDCLWTALGLSVGVWVFSDWTGSSREELNHHLNRGREMAIESMLDSFYKTYQEFREREQVIARLEEALREADPEWLAARVEARRYPIPVEWTTLIAERDPLQSPQ